MALDTDELVRIDALMSNKVFPRNETEHALLLLTRASPQESLLFLRCLTVALRKNVDACRTALLGYEESVTRAKEHRDEIREMIDEAKDSYPDDPHRQAIQDQGAANLLQSLIDGEDDAMDLIDARDDAKERCALAEERWQCFKCKFEHEPWFPEALEVIFVDEVDEETEEAPEPYHFASPLGEKRRRRAPKRTTKVDSSPPHVNDDELPF